MGMLALKARMEKELPVIEATLQELIDSLPDMVQPVAQHICSGGGKRIRPLLCLLMGHVCGLRHQDLYTLGSAVELLHAATLLHDDVLDHAILRRGKAAAHTVFSTTEVILAGDALLAKALQLVAHMQDARLTSCISQAVFETATGQITELSNVGNVGLAQATYLSIITGKTAWMLRAACELGALRAHAPAESVQAAADFGLNLGIAFQIVDDVLDFSPAEQTGKPQGGDIREGKFTYPLLAYLATCSMEERGLLEEQISSGQIQQDQIYSLCTTLQTQGHTDAALSLSATYLQQAVAALACLPDVPERALLESMATYVQNRTK